MVFALFQPLFNINTYLTIILALVSIAGDHIVSHTKLHLFQALFDNATHALVGALTWLIVCVNHKNRSHLQTLAEIALCAAVASLIDTDHFLAARSFYLKDATRLTRRPPFHCSTFPLVGCLLLLVLGYLLQVGAYKKASLIVLTAFASHHTRDATRRGFWFYPFGSTPPVPYCVYVGITCAIPFAVCMLHHLVKVDGGAYSFKNRSSVML